MQDELLVNLLEKLKSVNSKVNTKNIEKAYYFSKKRHDGQYRVSGEPYYLHPYEVALILCELGMDDVTIAAAFLHDVIEDTDVTHEELLKEFGKEIVELVEGVTKLDKIPYSSKEEQQVENLRKMFIAMAKDIRVIIIKLADRLHNMRTIKSLPDRKRREKALETMEIYAPLAHRLGINSIKWEIEDFSLMYLDPIAYKEIASQISQKRDERLKTLAEIEKNLEERFNEIGLKTTVEGRIKHFYSIYRKIYLSNKSIGSIYDLFAVRVIVDTVQDCYTALGVAHEVYKPIPGRFKDYISMPKKNMYQSLHSTLIAPNGSPFEIQIRTYEMHKTAEYGIAAHWKYKEGRSNMTDLDSKLSWVRQLLEGDRDSQTPKEFISNLKIDLFSDEVFVFTPKGDVMNLPLGSTAIDFAFAVHTQVGWKMVGAKVNGRIVPLETQLANGDFVEIITSSHTMGPSHDWLNIAKTSQARNKIRSWFKKENRSENIQKAREMLEKELKKLSVTLDDFDSNMQEYVLKKFSFNHIDDFYATMGYGRVSIERVINRVKEYLKKQKVSYNIEDLVKPSKNVKTNKSGIIVKGVENCLVKFARCCNPVPGDNVIGYITRGRGISVHRSDCTSIFNLEKADGDSKRLIPVEWSDNESNLYYAEVLITANDRPGLLVDITLCLNDIKVPLRAMNAKTTKDGLCFINTTLEITSAEKLNHTISKIKIIPDVISVSRTAK